MTLTKAERKRLAEEARKLAYECAEGTAPTLIRYKFTDENGCHCVNGELAARCGLAGREYEIYDDTRVTDDDWSAAGVVAEANNIAADADRHGAVVFPLLALADALDESTGGTP